MTHLELDNIFIPSQVPSKKLMIILHGRGDSSDGFTSLPPFLDIDEMNYLLLDAPFEYFNAQESFLFGFSQGALLTFEFGARYHKVLAGYIALSGYIYDAEKLLAEMNPEVNKGQWLCTHGTYDETLPFKTSEAQVQYLQDGGFDITFKSYPKDHNIDRDELAMIQDWIKARC